MRIYEITDDPKSIHKVTPEPFKAHTDAVKRQEKYLKVRKARIKAQKAQAAVNKVQQS